MHHTSTNIYIVGVWDDTAVAHLEFENINLEEDSARELLGPLRVHRGNL